MTITVTDIITPRIWRGYDDPGLPVGMYISHQPVIGNLSGGQMQAVFVFKPIGRGATGRFFNIEQVDMRKDATTTVDVQMFTTNFDQEANLGIGTRIWKWEMSNDGVGNAAIDWDRFPRLPLFLGQSTRLATQQTSLTIGVANDDGVALGIVVQGFIWEARSVQAPGGLRRPVDSVYGH